MLAWLMNLGFAGGSVATSTPTTIRYIIEFSADNRDITIEADEREISFNADDRDIEI